MTLYSKREKFKPLSLAVGKLFSSLPLSPNQWTLAALLIAIAGFITVSFGYILLGATFFALASFVDIIDGAVARKRGKTNNFGAFFDTVTDKYIEFLTIASMLFLPLPFFTMPAYGWIMLLVFGCLITSFVKTASAEKNVVQHKDGHGVKGGILEHTDRQLLAIVAIAMAAFYPNISMYLIAVLAVFANISAIQRIFMARKLWNAKRK